MFERFLLTAILVLSIGADTSANDTRTDAGAGAGTGAGVEAGGGLRVEETSSPSESLPTVTTSHPVDVPTDPARHWSFQPIRAPRPPEVRTISWPRSAIDRFILAALEREGLQPSPPAPPRDLIRRLSFDLVGLPPNPEDVEAFESEPSHRNLERIVDRLLGSPRYGERWGRWWLDVARYADTNGQDENKVMANAWRYRDWVIRAFNDNLAFDQFITHQIAGDLLPPGSTDATLENREALRLDRITATGFLVLGPKMLAEQDKPKLVMDIVDEQIDTVGRAFLGLTLGCARCHDHKFDPVPAGDYYALAGIFRSTRTMENLAFVSKFNERRVSTEREIAAREAHQERFAAITNHLAGLIRDADAALLASLNGDKEKLPKDPRPAYPEATRAAITELERQRDAALASAPPPIEYALAVTDDKPVDLPIHLRGSHLNLAKEPVPRGFPAVVARANPPPSIPQDTSGRLELTRWLVDPANPLTARVIVNRVWQAHFAEGLVRSPDNFGLRGDPPSHPDLLDWLATEFVRSGWNLKALHRLIVLSAAYQQSSRTDPSCESPEESPDDGPNLKASNDPRDLDPDNRLLSHFPRRRLEAEMIRDSLLHVSGRLDLAVGGSLVDWKNDEYTPADEVSARSLRRTVYLPIVRDRVYDALTLFDFANPSVTTARRVPTVVAQQALFFLNSPLVRDVSDAVASLVEAGIGPDENDRVTEAYRRILQRPPSPEERIRAREFLANVPPTAEQPNGADSRRHEALAAFCQVLLASNEFIHRP
ncbi:MAG: DUF1549 and DUF1553 domain-containing protein [Limisphaerales bacterium]